MRRIIFVDDDTRILDGLRRILWPFRHECDCTFVDNGPRALELLKEGAFDVIISDMRMPGMDGAELLARVQAEHPGVVRIILSGHSEKVSTLRSVSCAHQVLAKPCDPDALRMTITRSCRLRDLLVDERLRASIAGMTSLPVLPNVLQAVRTALASDDVSMERVGQILSADIGISAKILQLVNSAFFGLPRHIESVHQAAVYLGVNALQALILSTSIFEQMNPSIIKSLDADRLFDHSLTVGSLAKTLMRQMGRAAHHCDHAFLAGTVHDVGKLVLAANDTLRFAEVVRRSPGIHATSVAEIELFGVSHAEVGAYLLGLWAFPYDVVEAVGFHHRPQQMIPGDQAPDFTPLVAVHIANILDHEVRSSLPEETDLIDASVVAAFELTSKLDEWRALATQACAGAKP